MNEKEIKNIVGILEHSNIGLWVIEIEDGKPSRMFGDKIMHSLVNASMDASPEEMYDAWYNNIHPDFLDSVHEMVGQLTRGQRYENQYLWHDKDKGYIRVRCGGTRNFEYTNFIRFEGYHQDISQDDGGVFTDAINKREEKLKKALIDVEYATEMEEHVHEVLNSASFIMEYDRNCNIVSWKCKDAFRHLLEFENENDFPNEPHSWFSRIYAEDAGYVMETVDSTIRDLELQINTIDLEYRCVTKTGDIRWYRSRAHIDRREDGTPSVVYGVFQDIDEKKKQELRLQEALGGEYAFRETVESMHEILKSGSWNMDYDERGRLAETTWSSEFRHMIGYKDEAELPNDLKVVWNLVHKEDRKLAYQMYKQVIKDTTSKTIFDAKLRLFVKDYGYQWFHAAGKLTRSESGLPESFYGIFQNIHTEELAKTKLAEQFQIINTLSRDFLNIFAISSDIKWVTPLKMDGYVPKGVNIDTLETFPFLPVMTGYINTRVHPDDREMVSKCMEPENILNRLKENGEYIQVYRIINEKKKTEYYQFRFLLQEDGLILSAFQNVNDIILEQNKRMLRMRQSDTIIQSITDIYFAVYSVDLLTNTFTKARSNSSLAQLLGKTKSPMKAIDIVINNFVHEKHRNDAKEFLDISRWTEYLSEKNTVSIDLMSIRGHWGRINLIVADRDENHVPITVLVAAQNIHEEKIRIIQYQDALRDALAQAENSNRAKTIFLNNMSHDIRTPMNAIIGFTTLARSHIEHKNLVSEYLKKISTSSNHLLSLINDVLDMSRIESGKVKINEQPFHLPDLLHDIKTIVQADIAAKNLHFYINTTNVVNEDVYADKLRLNQVLLNLLSNAIKFTPEGGTIIIDIIQKSKTGDVASFEVRVSDTGMGMSEEFQKKIFEPFEREKSATVSGIQGTGLGMAITKNIIDMMHGSITLQSKVNKGTTFFVNLDFRVYGDSIRNDEITELVNKRALVIDDDLESCAGLSHLLSSIGLKADWTASVKDALSRERNARETAEPYDVFLVDVVMPEMNGKDLVQKLRKNGNSNAKIIMVSSYGENENEEDVKAYGADALVTKPVFMSDLRKALIGTESQVEKPNPLEEVRYDGKRVLVAEDNLLNQEIAYEILSFIGLTVEVVPDGSLAVERIEKGEEYDLIIMDIQMPIMDGYEATKAIRKLPNGKDIPILAMTANAFEEDRRKALEVGMNGHIAKPIEISILLEELGKVFQ